MAVRRIMSNFVIIDFRAETETKNSLSKYFEIIVKTNKKNTLDAVCGHADISLCRIKDDELIVCPSDYEYYKGILTGIKLSCGCSVPATEYPYDVCYNAACFGSFAVHNFRYTDKITLAVIEQKFSNRINVNQGYSKCSICGFEDDSAITDDDGIYNKLKGNGIDVLKISKGDVKLKGMNYGFFGGATGVFENNLFLNGELKYHRDADKIKSFLKNHGINIIELKKGVLTDIGSIVCLRSKI